MEHTSPRFHHWLAQRRRFKNEPCAGPFAPCFSLIARKHRTVELLGALIVLSTGLLDVQAVRTLMFQSE